MSPDDYIKSKITSPLSDITLRTRTNLLLASSTSIIIYHTGLIPNQIDGLGITFTQNQQKSFIFCLLVLVAYQLISFTLSAIPDYYYAVLRRKLHTEQLLQSDDFLKNSKTFVEMRNNFHEIFHPLETDPDTISRLLIYRTLFDIAIPLLCAIYALVVLVVFLSNAAS